VQTDSGTAIMLMVTLVLIISVTGLAAAPGQCAFVQVGLPVLGLREAPLCQRTSISIGIHSRGEGEESVHGILGVL